MTSFGFDSDTIAALSTPQGRGGIAVIRISGPATTFILCSIIEKWAGKNPQSVSITPGRAYHSFVIHNGLHIDECLVVYFKAPHSYTGEDVAEISTHSNPFLVEEILNLVCSCGPNIRNAMPGEFTFRAFKSGKMDLIQAESVNELINANSKYYAHMKFGSLEGKLSHFMNLLRENLINLGVRIETKIEFEEDQYLDEIAFSNELKEPLNRLDTLLSHSRFNELLDKGLNVVIVGKVNVGKSSLFNTLLMEERSITSSIPGTTRDFIKEKIYIDGFPLDITDVAGINKETRDDIEAQGIRRSLEKLETSDAVIFMVDVSRPLEAVDREIYSLIRGKQKIIVANKHDILNPQVWESIREEFKEEEIVGISVKQHINIDAIHQFLRQFIARVKGSVQDSDFAVNQRQKRYLEELRTILLKVKDMIDARLVQTEIIAEEIRSAVKIIGQLTGEITPEDILNKIFSEFCIGK